MLSGQLNRNPEQFDFRRNILAPVAKISCLKLCETFLLQTPTFSSSVCIPLQLFRPFTPPDTCLELFEASSSISLLITTSCDWLFLGAPSPSHPWKYCSEGPYRKQAGQRAAAPTSIGCLQSDNSSPIFRCLVTWALLWRRVGVNCASVKAQLLHWSSGCGAGARLLAVRRRIASPPASFFQRIIDFSCSAFVYCFLQQLQPFNRGSRRRRLLLFK